MKRAGKGRELRNQLRVSIYTSIDVEPDAVGHPWGSYPPGPAIALESKRMKGGELQYVETRTPARGTGSLVRLQSQAPVAPTQQE